MTKEQIIDYINEELQKATTQRDYYFEKYKKCYSGIYYKECMTWRTVCEILERILKNIK